MTREGDIWQIEHAGRRTALKNTRGMEMLSVLIQRPDQEIHVLDITSPAASTPVDRGSAGPEIDDQAKLAYQARLSELTEALEEAESLGDTGRADAAREEIDFITRELSRAYGLGGRARRTGVGRRTGARQRAAAPARCHRAH